jgi:hypothetical protein
MLGFMVARDEQHSAELLELSDHKSCEVVLLRCKVANITDKGEIGCLGNNFEDVVGFRSLEVQVGENL